MSLAESLIGTPVKFMIPPIITELEKALFLRLVLAHNLPEIKTVSQTDRPAGSEGIWGEK